MNKKETITLEMETIEKISSINTAEIYFTDNELDRDIVSHRIKNIVDIFSDLINVTKIELEDYFTEEEALEIVSSFTNNLCTLDFVSKRYVFDTVREHLYFKVPVACITEESRAALLNKLDRLTDLQAYVVMCMAKEYLSQVLLMDCENEKLKSIFSVAG